MKSNHPKPYREDTVVTNDGHRLYVACYGNPSGIPVFVLHGGPGYGSEPDMASLFDLDVWRVILADQRGAGHSRPLGSLRNNTTGHLVRDIDQIADYLDLGTFTIKGGSWGTTLALAYAESNPARVRSLILRGVFLGEKGEAVLTKIDGVQRHFPEAWHSFVCALPQHRRGEPFRSYAEYILTEVEAQSRRYAREAIVLELIASGQRVSREEAIAECETFDYLTPARIEYHYLINDYFLYPRQILSQCSLIATLPVSIIHGRFDMVCPPESAWRLAQALPNSRLHFVEGAGHSESDPRIASALVEAISQHATM